MSQTCARAYFGLVRGQGPGRAGVPEATTQGLIRSLSSQLPAATYWMARGVWREEDDPVLVAECVGESSEVMPAMRRLARQWCGAAGQQCVFVTESPVSVAECVSAEEEAETAVAA